MYDNEHLQKVIDTAKALQDANDASAAATVDLEAAQAVAADCEQEVERLRGEYDSLTKDSASARRSISRR